MSAEVAPTTVHCVTCGQDEPPITLRVPFRDPLKAEILANVGAGCWRNWLDQQLKIINEYRLNLADDSARALLERAAREVLHLGGGDQEAVLATGPEKARELGNL